MATEFYDNYGAVVAKRRTALGWTRYRLAKRAGVHPRTIKHIEENLHDPHYPTKMMVNRALDDGERNWRRNT